jgi:glycosyltransferase involved in cell wall biosynthesis
MVAPTYGDPTPFADAVAWFGAHVLPLLRQRLDRSVVLLVAGEDGSTLDISRSARAIVPLGRGTDPRLAFERSRVFVVPPPAAGALPLNLYDAAALGVPAVLAPAQARRVGWAHGAGALVAESADEFAAACIALYRDQLLWEGLLADARGRLAAVCDRARFDAMIGTVLLQAVSTRR